MMRMCSVSQQGGFSDKGVLTWGSPAVTKKCIVSTPANNHFAQLPLLADPSQEV